MHSKLLHSALMRCLLLSLVLAPGALWAQLQPRGISSLDNSFGQARPLPLEQAFPYFVSAEAGVNFTITWTPAAGHYLYRHAFAFSLLPSPEAEPIPLDFTLPDGLKKSDEFFGDIEAYYDAVSAEFNLEVVPGPEASLIIEYQGCADWGFCYPPQRSAYTITP